MRQKYHFTDIFTTIFMICIFGMLFGGIMLPSNYPSIESTSILNQPQISATFGDCVPPASGWWYINENTRVENLNVTLNGSISIGSNILVQFVNCDFRFASNYHITMGAANTTIDGLRVSACIDSIIYVSGCRNVTFRNMYLRGTGLDYNCLGIYGYHSQKLTVLNSTFQNFFKSIYAKNWSDCFFQDNLFEQTSDTQSTDGELQFDSSSNGNTFFRNTIRNMFLDGIEIRDGFNYNLTENSFTGGVSAIGISENVHSVIIRNNTLKNCCCGFGTNVSNVYIEYNNITNGWCGGFGVSDAIIRYNWFDYAENLTVLEFNPDSNITQVDNYFRFTVPTTTGTSASSSTYSTDSTTTGSPQPSNDKIDGGNARIFIGAIFACGIIIIRKIRKSQ